MGNLFHKQTLILNLSRILSSLRVYKYVLLEPSLHKMKTLVKNKDFQVINTVKGIETDPPIFN